MKVLEVPWGSEEWFEVRRGRVTASMLGCVLSKPTTKKYRHYLVTLALDLLGDKGWPDDAPWFEHGKDLEPRARGAYEWKFNCTMRHDIFIIHDDFSWLACTPDGLLSDRGIEIKGREKLRNYVRHTDKIAPTYLPQIQGSMLITGMSRWEYVNYYEDPEQKVRKLHVEPVSRDEHMCDRLIEKAAKFYKHVQKVAESYGEPQDREASLKALRAELPRPYERLSAVSGIWIP